MRRIHTPRRTRPPRWGGVSTLDSILVIGIILPLAAVVMPLGKRIIQLVYEMTAVFIAWPFM